MFNDYFVNIASSIGFEDRISGTKAAILKPLSVMEITENFAESEKSHFVECFWMISVKSWNLLLSK